MSTSETSGRPTPAEAAWAAEGAIWVVRLFGKRTRLVIGGAPTEQAARDLADDERKARRWGAWHPDYPWLGDGQITTRRLACGRYVTISEETAR